MDAKSELSGPWTKTAIKVYHRNSYQSSEQLSKFIIVFSKRRFKILGEQLLKRSILSSKVRKFFDESSVKCLKCFILSPYLERRFENFRESLEEFLHANSFMLAASRRNRSTSSFITFLL
jgi:hypothetical protein